MQINWPLVIFLFCLAIPGVLIATPKLIGLLLPDNSEQVRSRFSFIVIVQNLIMVFLMSLAGVALSSRTGLSDPILEGLLQGKPVLDLVQPVVLPVLALTLFGLTLFFVLYYGVVGRLLDTVSLLALKKLRAVFGLDGAALYNGVVEEILIRWGLMNVIVFFMLLLLRKKTDFVFWTAIILSGLMYMLTHLPVYIAAGCKNSRRFVYLMLALNCFQSVLFGWIFWHHGILAAICSHLIFNLGWYLYDSKL
ncbi:type II CAAX prenyl endopeptidase Rce1 family protein [Legionella dresdenensis]|uniref:Type II CAAX prenyl endopeptidase Rce1 family protein n=1 Tax=Legionella dresdenensis TaxID=450200 RepID=A0ABV8CG59_9GAMM